MKAALRLATVASIAVFLCTAAHATQWSAAKSEELRALTVGERISLSLPEREGATVFERIEVYAPDARVWVIDEQGKRQIPRSNWIHFIAQSGAPAAVSIDPDSGHIEGLQLLDGQRLAISGHRLADGGTVLSSDRRIDQDSDGNALEWSCGGAIDAGEHLPSALKVRSLPALPQPKGAPATRQARIAVDTDNEFMSNKFSNNTSNAQNYITALFAGMNGIYELAPGAGGLDVRLVIGDVLLRTTPDPYVQQPRPLNEGGGVRIEQLNEFGAFWQVSQTGVQRAFAMLLSGKAPLNNSASGIAWVLTSGNYCNATGQMSGGNTFGHYSFSQVFWNPATPASADVFLVAHELGHNFGAFHTHCTAVNGTGPTGVNTMDQCFSGETVGATACYSGSVSCPGGGVGTLMSYCHFPTNIGGPNCGPANLQFHPGHVSNLSSRIASNFPGCITPLTSVDPIFDDGFE